MSPHWPTQILVCQKTPMEQIAVDASQSHCVSKHLPMMPEGQNLTEQIQEGSFYEIDRSKLPTRTPSLLRQSIRVVMVTVKANQHLTVRYPSTKSLEAHHMGPSVNLYPEMDEKFIMGSQLAAEVLVRRIPSSEFARNSSSTAFWFLQSSKPEMPPLPLTVSKPVEDAVMSKLGTPPLPLTVSKPVENAVMSKLGTCLSRLQSSNIKSWGERRLVSYVKNAEKISSDGQSSSHSIQAPVVKLEIEEVEDSAKTTKFEERRHGSPGNDGQHVSSIGKAKLEEIKKEMEDQFATNIPRPRKRKCRSFTNGKKARTTDLLDEKKGKVAKKQDLDKFRWSELRYENAKNELYAVMRARRSTSRNPISRHGLRAEARKRIGDTGLLDHLLKHVVDTLAPGGTERFRRRWDSRGVMEYWLESADLADVRKKAGVQDPYWIPPLGWKIGDPICSHSSDCDAVINALKEELAQMQGEMQVMAAEKHEHTQANLSVLCNIGNVESINPAAFKERYDELVKEKERRELELVKISESLKKMEELLMRK